MRRRWARARDQQLVRRAQALQLSPPSSQHASSHLRLVQKLPAGGRVRVTGDCLGFRLSQWRSAQPARLAAARRIERPHSQLLLALRNHGPAQGDALLQLAGLRRGCSVRVGKRGEFGGRHGACAGRQAGPSAVTFSPALPPTPASNPNQCKCAEALRGAAAVWGGR